MKIIVSGINGRMGSAIARTVLEQGKIELVGGIAHGDGVNGVDIGTIIGGKEITA